MTDHHKDHEQRLTLHIDVMLPGHDDRVTTKEFEQAKRQLIHVEDQGCWICGGKDKREVHHFHIERSLGNRIKDWGPGSNLRKDFPDFPWDSITNIYQFIDSAANCRVYCKDHHTGKVGSIHFMPHPLQNAMRYMSEAEREEYLMLHVANLEQLKNGTLPLEQAG